MATQRLLEPSLPLLILFLISLFLPELAGKSWVFADEAAAAPATRSLALSAGASPANPVTLELEAEAERRYALAEERLGLLRAQKFDTLDDQLQQTLAAFKAEPTREDPLFDALLVFEVGDPALTPLLEAWIAHSPGTWMPVAARSFHHFAMGWRERGTATADRTSDRQMQNMQTRFAVALESCTAALKLEPMLLPCYALEIRLATALGGDDTALATLEQGLKQFPGSLRLRVPYMISLEPRWGGSYEKMSAFASKAEELAGQYPALEHLRAYLVIDQGDALRVSGRWDEAQKLYEQVMALDNFLPLYRERGIVHAQAKRYQEAMDDYRRALLYLPLDDELHRRYASMAYYVKQLDIARENIRRAAVLDPVNPQTQSWLDRISHIPPDLVDVSNAVTQALETDRLEDALQAADAALSAAPESAELLSLKGQILARQGNFEGARASLEQAAKSAPLLADPHEWLGYLGLKEENWDLCVREYSEAIERDPGLENAICKRGYCYSRLNEDDRAGEDITSACQMGDETCCQVLSKHSDRGWLKLILPAIALGGVLMLYRLRKRARARLA